MVQAAEVSLLTRYDRLFRLIQERVADRIVAGLGEYLAREDPGHGIKSG
jgi:hypothetical protein